MKAILNLRKPQRSNNQFFLNTYAGFSSNSEESGPRGQLLLVYRRGDPVMIDNRSLVIRIASCLFMSVLAVSCTHNLILNHEIEAMQITTNPPNAKGVTVQINDPGTIQEVVGKMNHSTQEPVKFRAYYSVKLKYRGGKEVEIWINGRGLELDGKTYTANEDIGAMLSRLIKR